MTKIAIAEQIDTIRAATAKATSSKKAAIKFISQAGLSKLMTTSKTSTSKKAKKLK